MKAHIAPVISKVALDQRQNGTFSRTGRLNKYQHLPVLKLEINVFQRRARHQRVAEFTNRNRQFPAPFRHGFRAIINHGASANMARIRL